ncbi:MAG: tRNA pseudouridine(55) synthase TruB [Saprospiraceae bacterium]|nr:tRNA pseudouridine(55) synthase TruB [Saprospiraceae bacterium]
MFFQDDKILTNKNLPEEIDFSEGTVMLIDKPLNWTSFDVVNKLRFKIRHTFGIKKIKVGHAGTLDPLASGLLIVCTGKATKSIDLLQALDKSYSGSIFLGASTPTYDAESQPDFIFETDHITSELIQDAVASLSGELLQRPPLFSAIKVDGQKGYQLARRGEDVELPKRKVQIKEFTISEQKMPLLSFYVQCSKGTYIRSLAHDLGKALESGGYLASLRRESIAEYSVKDALTVEEAVSYIERAGTNSKIEL